MVYSLRELDRRLRTFYYFHASLRRLEKLMEFTRREKTLPMSRFIYVEPTNACNYKCPKCPQISGLGRPIAYLDVDLFKDLVAQLKPHRPRITLHHSGEPMLHPRLFDLIRIARDAGLQTIVVTNASLLDKEDFRMARDGPDTITFSVDGASPDVYGPAHGGASWEKIQNNIEEFFKRLESKSRTRFVQMAIVKGCQMPEQLEEYYNFTRRFPFAAVLTKPYFVWPDGKGVTPIADPLPRHWSYPCGHPWLSPAILADGSVVPCCLDAHGLYPAGNIGEKPFLEIYRGEKLERLRRHLMNLDGTPPLALCDSCGLKRLAISFSRRGRFLFHTMFMWKHFFPNMPTPVDV